MIGEYESMQKLTDYIDLRSLIYLCTTVFVIFAGWFGLKERVSLLASEIEHNRVLLTKQERHFECLKNDVTLMRESIIRIQVLLQRTTDN